MIIPGGDNPYYTNSTQLPVERHRRYFRGARHAERPPEAVHGRHGVPLRLSASRSKDGNMQEAGEENRRERTKCRISPSHRHSRSAEAHGYLRGRAVLLPHCGEETEVYSRIVGYYRPVQNWNLGKKSEYRDRKLYKPDMLRNDGRLRDNRICQTGRGRSRSCEAVAGSCEAKVCNVTSPA